MSLHLIESTKRPSASTRKRGGATASVVVHALLVIGAFTAASAAPVLEEARRETEVIYVAPEPPRVPTAANQPSTTVFNSAASVAAPSPPVMPDLLNIPIDIPPISSALPTEVPETREFGRRVAGNGTSLTGVVGAGGRSTMPDSAIMNDRQVDKTVAILSGYRTPRYPEGMRSAGVEETLSATFVVDTLGRIEGGSLQIVDLKHAPFEQAVRDALANARFRPAEVGGRRVRQRVVQAFVFSLQRE